MKTFGQLRDESYQHIADADQASDLNEPREAVEHLILAVKDLHSMVIALSYQTYRG